MFILVDIRKEENEMASPKSNLMLYPKPPEINKKFYNKLAQEVSKRTLCEKYIVPIRTGKAWPVKAGQICRIVLIEGPQVGDFNCWNLHNPREHFWQARTRQFQNSHISTHDRLWSTLPYLRPMLTIINDTIAYGVDEDGARCHDLLGARCDPYLHKLLKGENFDYTCHSNLTRAIIPYGLTEFDVHDVLNMFQITGIKNDRNFNKQCKKMKKGDFFEFFAEIDLLCAISTCPNGDFADNCRPLGVKVYQSASELLRGWESPKISNYRGNHGLKLKLDE